MTRHHMFDPEGMTPAVGFSHGALPASGNTLYIAGQTGHHPDLTIDASLVAQFGQACRSVLAVIEDAGGGPKDLVSMTIYTTAIAEYRDSLGPIGESYREVFGRHFPPMALFGIDELFDPEACVEVVCVAVVPA
jgi:enamine deaminase RidA (YjgF/YER057c/UK114 family)